MAALRTARRLGRTLAPDINVTPLVDVVLVLLIIFMVIAPKLEAGRSVELPKLRNTDANGKTTDPTTLSLTADGALYFDQEARPTEPPSMRDRFGKIGRKGTNQRVLLKADRSVPYGKVRAVLAAAQAAGLPGIALQVDQQKQETR